jgi:hypothetical protein
MVLQGLLSVFVPRKAVKLGVSGLRMCFENVGDLEPREWYVETTKVLGIGMLVAGLAGLLVTRPEPEPESEDDEDETESVTVETE